MRIVRVDQVDLPLPMPAFELLFAQDSALHVAKQLEMDEHVNPVVRREPRQGVAAVLGEAKRQVGGHADVQRSIRPACKDVDARLPFVMHAFDFAEQWVLKQVQDDGIWGHAQ